MEYDAIGRMMRHAPSVDRDEREKLLRRYVSLRDMRSAGANAEAERIKSQLVLMHLGLVAKFVNLRWRRSQMHDELFQEGCFGLMRALEKFDVNNDAQFSTYATWWIKSFTMRYLTNNGYTIRLPWHIRQLLSGVKKAQTKHALLNDTVQTIDELQEAMSAKKDVKMSAIELALESDYFMVSGNQQVKSDRTSSLSYTTLFDMLSAENVDIDAENEKRMAIESMKASLQKLEPREQTIIIRRFGLFGCAPGSLTDVSLELDISRERVRQIEREAITKITCDMKRKANQSSFDAELAQREPNS
jgi:RNA polymerase nonessential primary-like sigma factor